MSSPSYLVQLQPPDGLQAAQLGPLLEALKQAVDQILNERVWDGCEGLRIRWRTLDLAANEWSDGWWIQQDSNASYSTHLSASQNNHLASLQVLGGQRSLREANNIRQHGRNGPQSHGTTFYQGLPQRWPSSQIESGHELGASSVASIRNSFQESPASGWLLTRPLMSGNDISSPPPSYQYIKPSSYATPLDIDLTGPFHSPYASNQFSTPLQDAMAPRTQELGRPDWATEKPHQQAYSNLQMGEYQLTDNPHFYANPIEEWPHNTGARNDESFEQQVQYWLDQV